MDSEGGVWGGGEEKWEESTARCGRRQRRRWRRQAAQLARLLMSCALQVPLPGRALPRPRQSHPPLSRSLLLRVVRDDPADPRGAGGGQWRS